MPKQPKLIKDVTTGKRKVAKAPQGPKLTMKQELFVAEYVRNGGNGAQAAKDAGYKCSSEDAYKVVASNNLTKVYLREAIEAEKARKAREKQLKIPSATEVLAMLADIAGDKNEKTQDRLKALDSLAKYHSLYTEKLQVQNVDYAAIIAESRARATAQNIGEGAPVCTKFTKLPIN